MRRSFAKFAALLLVQPFSTTFAQFTYPPYDYGVERSTIVKRQSSSSYAITGIHTGTGPNGSTPLRLEIRDLENDPITWTLYILGLDMLQYTPQTQMLSWYQIAGIHGRPFVAFDSVQATPGNQNNGYCTHVSILFPTWHRPYLALYEQVLYGMIQQIAQQYPAGPVRDQYTTAAANFRIPYWDWAAIPAPGKSVFPNSVGGSPSILVNGPAGAQVIANPLFSYQFKPLDRAALPDIPFNRFSQTLRYPTSQAASAVSQNNLVAQQLDNNAPSIRNRLYILLTNYNDYTTWSNEAWIKSGDPSYYDSIESLHDQIHGLTGSGGHMTFIDYSGFDPTFWLHHAMVDRAFAMWQILNPSTFVVPEPAIYSTFTQSSGQTQDMNTPLKPFHSDTAGTFWTSNTARNIATFGYAYPETAQVNGNNVTEQVITAINRLYGPSASAPNLQRRRENTVAGIRTEWIANIRVEKYALEAPFFVHVFVGPFGSDPSSWSYDSNLAGTQAIFIKAASSIPASSIGSSRQLVSATIPLTNALEKSIESGKLNSMNAKDVTPFLMKHMSYRVTYFNDTAVPNEDVPSLKISVVSVEVEDPGSDSDLPVWKKARGHIDVNMGAR